jgi:quercetin dioxygenase-like cupin family protein
MSVDLDSSHLDKLREKTRQLPEFPQERFIVGSRFYEYNVHDGLCFARHLFSDDNVSVAVWKNEEGSEFPAHRHEEKEWLIVFKGKMEAYIEGEGTITVGEGQSLILEPNIVHSIKFLEETHSIGVTVPKSEDFPQEVTGDGTKTY